MRLVCNTDQPQPPPWPPTAFAFATRNGILMFYGGAAPAFCLKLTTQLPVAGPNSGLGPSSTTTDPFSTPLPTLPEKSLNGGVRENPTLSTRPNIWPLTS